MPNQLFFIKWVDKIIIGMLWWVILMVLIFWIPFLRPWWWVFLPLFLSIELKKLYLWWVRWDFAYSETKWVVLEMIPPKEILTPLKAMEDVFSAMWAPLFDTANWREKWFDGELNDTPYWMSFEIASIEGELHFYTRVMQQFKSSIEGVLYSHYPELEIHEAQDYTRDVPQNIPNGEWDVYGEDFILRREDPYPIKTYESFFEPQGEKVSAEEKRIDPINSILEMMSKLGRGEQFWLQFIIMATGDNYDPKFKREAERIISKLSRRPVLKKNGTFMDDIGQVLNGIIFGPKKEVAGDKVTYKWTRSTEPEMEGDREMVLTPGERETITAIENKIKKLIFRTVMRGVYVAKRENWHASNGKMTRAYFSHFLTKNLNSLGFSILTRPKTHYVFRKRIPFLRARRMFRNYVLRFPPHFPDRKKECSILNTEELATLFHFPLKITATVLPTVVRVESRKGGPPPNLPIK